jgi:hypothetical protein
VLLPAAVAFGLLLLWGIAIVWSGVGTHVCEHYTYLSGGENEKLRAWCTGTSWRGWLGTCLLGAGAAYLIGLGVAWWTGRPLWLLPGSALAALGVWLGFALPQVLAGENAVAQTTPSTAAPATPTVARPTTPSAPATTPEAGPVGRPPSGERRPGTVRGIDGNVTAGAAFRCPHLGNPPEVLRGPGAETAFDRVSLSRGPRGLCATFTGAAVASTIAAAQYSRDVLALYFRRGGVGDPDRLVIGGTPGLVTLELWTENGGATYKLIVYRPHASASQVTVGDIGVEGDTVSILVRYPRLPDWVLDPRTPWAARLH